MSLVIYDATTGRPKRLHNGSTHALQRERGRMAEGEAALEGDFACIVDCWVTDGALVPTTPTAEDHMRDLRRTRDRLLRAHVDAMNPVRWETMSDIQKQDWRGYRQALLDMPATATDPAAPIWPVKPEG